MNQDEAYGKHGISDSAIPDPVEESAEEKPLLPQADEALEEGARGCEPNGDGVGGEDDAVNPVEEAELVSVEEEEGDEPLAVRAEMDATAEVEAGREVEQVDASVEKDEPLMAVAEEEDVEHLVEKDESLVEVEEEEEEEMEPLLDSVAEEALQPMMDAADDKVKPVDAVVEKEMEPVVDGMLADAGEPLAVDLEGDESKPSVCTLDQEEVEPSADAAAKEEMKHAEEVKPLFDALAEDSKPLVNMADTETLVEASAKEEAGLLVDDAAKVEMDLSDDAGVDVGMERLPLVDAKAEDEAYAFADAMPEMESLVDVTVGKEPEPFVDKVAAVDASAEEIEPSVGAMTDAQIEPLIAVEGREGTDILVDTTVGEEPEPFLDTTAGEKTMTTVDASAEEPESFVGTSAQEETVGTVDASAEEIEPLVDAMSDEQIETLVNSKEKEATEGLVDAKVGKSLEQLVDSMANEMEKSMMDAALEKREEMEPLVDATAEKEMKFLADGTAEEVEKPLVESVVDDEHLMKAAIEEESELLVGAAVEETEQLLDVMTEEAGEPSAVAMAEEAAEHLVDGIAEEVEEPLLDAMAGAETEAPIVTTTRGGGKRKRGRPPKSQMTSRTPTRRKVEEDVCFICFDGGNLVVCDRRGCPKVYHPSCVNRDEAFFRSKGKWNCGWHICSSCEKPSNYMCYACTYSLCKGCIKESGFVCVRGNKGLCQTCMSTVMLIETNYQINKPMPGVDFDDKNSWEYLFKDYWLDLKGKLSITLEELTKAKTPRKESNVSAPNNESSDELFNANDDQVASSDSSAGHRKATSSSRKKLRKRSRSTAEERQIREAVREEAFYLEDTDWASKELLEFVAHMKDGNRSFLSQFDVQALLLEYIKLHNLRDPRRKSQIICDARLQSLFGKPRVGHFEMLKLLESHFLVKEATQPVTDDSQGGVVDPDSSPVDAEGYSDASTRMNLDKRRKTRRRTDREPQTNIDDYAAIDVHNINLMYLRRNLMEELIDDTDGFSEKVIGSFVRIRISAAGQKQDMYRLVQVVGTRRAPDKYKTGRKVTDFVLEILNLDKTEVITIDIISNQEFTEEECKRLRQSIKCGLIDRLTVGDVQTKARALQAVRVHDWLENEKSRLSHLRDRASETGRRKELRECVEKLQTLNNPEERIRRLHEVPEIHTDPHMDPDYESAEEGGESEDKRLEYNRPRGSSLRKSREANSLGKGGFSSSGIWNAEHRSSSSNLERTEGSFDRVESQRKELNNNQFVTKPGESESTLASVSTVINENEKMWRYQDPSGKVQGPFSMTQLKKWNTTGYFPKNLKIWKASDKQEDSILLADALDGKFLKDLPRREPQHSLINQQKGATSSRGWESSTNTNTWSGEVQGCNSPRAPASFSGNPYQSSSYGNAGRWSGGQDNRNAWNSNGPQGQTSNQGYERRPDWSSCGQQSVGEQKVQATYGSCKPRDNDAFNLPTPTSQATSMAWIASQATNNSTATVQPLSSGWSHTPRGIDSHPSSSLTQGSSDTVRANPAAGWGINNLANITKQTEIGGNFSSHTSTSAPMSTYGKVVEILGTAQAGFGLAFHPQLSSLGAANILRSQSSHESISGDKMSPVKNTVVLGGSSSGEGSVKNQFFVSDCPSPTPKSEQTGADALSSEYSQPSKSDIFVENLPGRGLMSNLQNIATFTSRSVLSDIHNTSVDKLEKADSNASVSAIKQDQQDPGLISAAAGNAWEITQASNRGPSLSGLEPVTSGNFQLPSETKSSEWSMPSPTPANTPSRLDIANNSATMNNQNNQLTTYGSELLANSQWGSNTSNASAQQLGTGLVNSMNDVQNSGWGVPSQNSNTSIGPTQGTANIGSGSVIQGNLNQGWGMIPQGNMNLAWGIPAQSNANTNMSWANPAQVNTNANIAWTTTAQGNTNANMAWGALPQGNMIMNAGLSTTTPQGVASLMPTQGYPNTQPGWGTSQSTNQNASWGTAQGNKNGNPVIGATQWNTSTTWDPSNGNPSSWNTQQNQNGDGNSGPGDRGFQSNDLGHGGGRQPWNRPHSAGGGGGGSRNPPSGPRTGVCRFHESGHCKKGANCNYYHA